MNQWACRLCSATQPNFKALIDHYREQHRGSLKRYYIRRKDRTQQSIIYATSVDEALTSLGWTKEDCKITEIN